MLMMTLSYFLFLFSPLLNSCEGWKHHPNRLIHTFTLSRLHRTPLFLPTGDIFFVSVHFNKPLECKTWDGRNFYLKFKTGIKRDRLFSSYYYFFSFIFILKLEFQNIVFLFSFYFRCSEESEACLWCLRSIMTIELLWLRQGATAIRKNVRFWQEQQRRLRGAGNN